MTDEPRNDPATEGPPPEEGAESPPSFMDDLTGSRSTTRDAVLIPALAVVSALIVGAIILVITDPDLWAILTSDPGSYPGQA